MNRYIYIVLLGIIWINFPVQRAFGQNAFRVKVSLPEKFDQIVLRSNTSLLNTDKRPYSDTIPFQVIDGVLMAEGEISGPTEFVMLNADDFSCIFVIEAGENEFNLFLIPDSNQLEMETITGPIAANTILSKIRELYNSYLQRYGEIIVTEPHGRKIFILNKKEKINDYLMDKIELLRHSPLSYYSLIEYLDISRRGLDLAHIEKLAEATAELPPDLQSTQLGRELSYELHATISDIKANYIGQPVPTFSVEDEYGKYISNANFAGRRRQVA